MLTGDNGIITQANNAKEKSEIAEEKEKVQLSAQAVYAKEEGGEILKDKLAEELGSFFKEGKYVVKEGINEDGTEGYIVTITENDPNGRKYFVGKNGILSEGTGKELAEPTQGTGKTFTMGVGAIEVEFLEGTGYEAGKANEPLLDEKTMIPIKYNGTNWVVTTKNDSEWYNYDTENRKWANVMLSDGTYTVDEVTEGQVIQESELGSMFVWIPRYAYKIAYFDSQPDKEAYIASNRTDTTKITGYSDARGIVDKEGKVPSNITNNQTSIAVGDNYRPHPVFENNQTKGGWDQKLTGIWVGKFETTTKKSENGANMILPNQTSQRSLNVSTMFSRAQAIGTNLNMTLDSHMMKNTEWGAVAYLTESKYGRNGTEISVNQCGNYITGAGRGTGDSPIYNSTYGAITEEQKYNGSIGMISSTTGNVYGIYDLSGGAYEYVMGMYQDSNGNIHTGNSALANSGFNGYLNDGTEKTDGVDLPKSKYYNLYTTKNNTNIGDALYETSGWNTDYSNFVNSSPPFFGRGGSYNATSGAGVFSFNFDYGSSGSSYGFRVCLAVK